MKLYSNLFLAITFYSAIAAELATLKVTPEPIAGSYLIKLNPNTRSTMEAHLDEVRSLFTDRSDLNKIESVYHNLGKMYHARLSDEVVSKLRALPEVAYIETDSKVKLESVQTNAPWGLARVSQRNFTSNSTYKYDGEGSGVAVYVLDTGVQIDHPEFEGRAKFGARFSGDNDNDDNGHGTHCAGVVGSKTYGVSKKAEIVAVKVLHGFGTSSISSVIDGLNWVVGDKRGIKGNIISMSLSSSKVDYFNEAVQIVLDKGIPIIVAAGNDRGDACIRSPASVPGVITVASSDIKDNLSRFSNFGPCVDIFAPGTDILSTWANSTTFTASGTSMSTPHVAGLAAYYLSKEKLNNTQLLDKLLSTATKNAILKNKPNTINLLAYNNID